MVYGDCIVMERIARHTHTNGFRFARGKNPIHPGSGCPVNRIRGHRLWAGIVGKHSLRWLNKREFLQPSAGGRIFDAGVVLVTPTNSEPVVSLVVLAAPPICPQSRLVRSQRPGIRVLPTFLDDIRIPEAAVGDRISRPTIL